MLTPVDLEHKEFKKKLGGYDREDVDEFFSAISTDYKNLYIEYVALKDKVNSLSGAVGRYKSMEDVMQNTLIVAQSTSDELKRVANEKAKVIIAEAESKASEVIMDAQKRVAQVEREFAELITKMNSYKIQMLTALRTQTEFLEKNMPES